jgi:5-methylcytosine-specific restriction endonuclease McrA
MTERQIKIAERKAKAIDLLGGKCVECGNEGTSGLNLDKLEFDHIKRDRLDYKHKLCNMWDYSWDKVVAELKKCQLLCRKCHIQKTIVIDMGQLPRSVVIHGTANAYVNRQCRCVECTRANADKMRNYYRSKHKMVVA